MLVIISFFYLLTIVEGPSNILEAFESKVHPSRLCVQFDFMHMIDDRSIQTNVF